MRVLVVGCGNMGASHATAYHNFEGFEICGIVSTGKSKEVLNEKLGGGYALYSDYAEALQVTQPDAVCISTYPDTVSYTHLDVYKRQIITLASPNLSMAFWMKVRERV